jgi:DNA invertase Pin-like site-specific DNA recombinase
MRVVGYVRVSKADGQSDDRHSITAQCAAIEKASEYHAWQLVGIERDNGKTGAHTRRDGFQSALATLKRGDADMLVAARLDRLSRSISDFAGLLRDPERQGWKLAVLDVDIDTSTANGWLSANMLALLSEWERRMISERTRAALASLKAQGKLGRPSPIHAELQRRIVRLHRRGNSASAIARKLSAEGIPTPTGKATWHHSVIVDLIRRRAAA